MKNGIWAKNKMRKRLLKIYSALATSFGKQQWWPAEGAFEVVVGAVLTQNTNWKNVEKAIANLKKARMLDARRIANADLRKLQVLIKPSGFYRQKAKRLREVAREYLHLRKSETTTELRKQLLSINGVGEETADSILLYALNRPVFVIDAYTRRFVERHELIDGASGTSERSAAQRNSDSARAKTYSDYQKFFDRNLPKSSSLYNNYHALIVELGKKYCRKKAECESCPLRFDLSKRRFEELTTS